MRVSDVVSADWPTARPPSLSSPPPFDVSLAPDVILVLVDDGTARLLDLGGEFVALTETAAALLHESLLRGRAASVARAVREYDVDRPRAAEDLDRLLTDLSRRDMLRAGLGRPESPRRPAGLRAFVLLAALRFAYAIPAPMTARCRVLLGIAHGAIRLIGWPATVRAFQALHARDGAGGRPAGRAGTSVAKGGAAVGRVDAAVSRVDIAVNAAVATHPLGVECKERGLVGWSVLRSLGVPAELVVGVDLLPFTSHCWCRLGERVVGDFPDRCESFTPIKVYTWPDA